MSRLCDISNQCSKRAIGNTDMSSVICLMSSHISLTVGRLCDIHRWYQHLRCQHRMYFLHVREEYSKTTFLTANWTEFKRGHLALPNKYNTIVHSSEEIILYIFSNARTCEKDGLFFVA